MKKESDLKLLQQLINIEGVSSDEGDVRRFIIKEAKKYVKNVKVDKMGNVIAIKKGAKPAMMLLAHMDEIGLMISSVGKKGRLYISPIGGIDPFILVGQRVHVKTDNGYQIGGVITTDDVLDGLDVSKNLKMHDLYIYTGLTEEELTGIGIQVGNYVTFSDASNYCTLGARDIIGGKALDDRIGCYILLELMRKVKTKYEVIFVFTVQEEVGLYGAKVSVFNVQPDYAIAVDVVPHNTYNDAITLRNGPVLTVKDAEMISNKCITEALESIAKKNKIKLQLEVSESGTTDATSVFAAKGGIPSAVLGVAVGNLHTAMSVASRSDVEEAITVLGGILKSPPQKCV